jgi:hypothetical protein
VPGADGVPWLPDLSVMATTRAAAAKMMASAIPAAARLARARRVPRGG